MNKDLSISIFIAATFHAVALFAFDSSRPEKPKSVPAGDEPFLPAFPIWNEEPTPIPVDTVVDSSVKTDKAPMDEFQKAAPSEWEPDPGSVRPDIVGTAVNAMVQPIQIGRRADLGNAWGDQPSGFGNFVPLDGLDDDPQAIAQIAPQFPHELRRAGIEGRVVVSFVINQEGRVRSIEVIESSDAAFSSAAVAAVKRWKFTPGTSGGRPVSFRMSIPVVFSLSDG